MFTGAGIHVSGMECVWAYENQIIREYIIRIMTKMRDGVVKIHWGKGN